MDILIKENIYILQKLVNFNFMSNKNKQLIKSLHIMKGGNGHFINDLLMIILLSHDNFYNLYFYRFFELRKTSYLELINKYKVKKDLLRDNFLEYKNLIKSSLIIITLLITSITIINIYGQIFNKLLRMKYIYNRYQSP